MYGNQSELTLFAVCCVSPVDSAPLCPLHLTCCVFFTFTSKLVYRICDLFGYFCFLELESKQLLLNSDCLTCIIYLNICLTFVLNAVPY